ncbi:glutamate 5-kinase [Clostridium prolinivorans]|uniref:glutamate 5-kinase n=1 Tax=Clostridium prolinivorans TaxID=2769420 RepID=UPI000FDA74C6|nr:glutamate 5-kinase [Clostridium prolinivorans]
MNCRKNYLKGIKRVVVKVGTSTLTHSSGLLNLDRIESLVRQLANLHNQNIEVILVTSGAVGAGMGKLGLKTKPKTIPEKQAAAAVGQGILLHMYEKIFSEYGKTIAQILLTKDDFANRNRFLNARNTFFALLDKGVIPIVNENDAVVVDEIKVGDNDTLSALVSSLVEADLLILLSDIDGLYDDNPNINSGAKLIHFVDSINDDIENMANGSGTKLGTGGMATKLSAGRIATASGTAMIIANGSKHSILQDIIDGKDVGTLFKPKECPLQAKKHWIAYSTDISGRVIIDKGAEKALIKEQCSLLPSGIAKVEGCFNEGAVISIYNYNGKEIGRGVTNYSSSEIELILGKKSSDIEKILGHKHFDEAIHRNNMVIF